MDQLAVLGFSVYEHLPLLLVCAGHRTLRWPLSTWGSMASVHQLSHHTRTEARLTFPTVIRGIFITGSSLLGAAQREPRITSKNLIRQAKL